MISLYFVFFHLCTNVFVCAIFLLFHVFEKNYLGSLLGGGVDNVLSNTLPLSEPMLAGITQHWGRFNEYSFIYLHIYFMFSLFIFVFTIVICTIEYALL